MDGKQSRVKKSKLIHAPSVSLAFPPVGWQSTLVHEGQTTTVCACEKTVVMAKQPGGNEVKYVGKYIMFDRISRNDAIEVNPPQETG